jgi:hypothetical protein
MPLEIVHRLLRLITCFLWICEDWPFVKAITLQPIMTIICMQWKQVSWTRKIWYCVGNSDHVCLFPATGKNPSAQITRQTHSPRPSYKGVSLLYLVNYMHTWKNLKKIELGRGEMHIEFRRENLFLSVKLEHQEGAGKMISLCLLGKKGCENGRQRDRLMIVSSYLLW